MAEWSSCVCRIVFLAIAAGEHFSAGIVTSSWFGLVQKRIFAVFTVTVPTNVQGLPPPPSRPATPSRQATTRHLSRDGAPKAESPKASGSSSPSPPTAAAKAVPMQSDAAIPTGSMARQPLWNCCAFGPCHSHFLNSWFCRSVLIGQLLTRMKMDHWARYNDAMTAMTMRKGTIIRAGEPVSEFDPAHCCILLAHGCHYHSANYGSIHEVFFPRSSQDKQ
ncbi:hypothetical protein ACHAWO_010221 [Cyclotella atomus]|uniref:Uncharacterized protein n=1 Tax=Cyclotella atomus TaxID=382360 RepID=A0ABD3NN45_9STRA